MNSNIRDILFCFLFLFISEYNFAQCETHYTDVLYSEILYLNISKVISIDTVNGLNILADSSTDRIVERFTLPAGNYNIGYKVLQPFDLEYYVEDVHSGETLIFGTDDGWARYDFAATDNFIYFDNGRRGKLFDPKTGRILNLKHDNLDIIGYDNESVYLRSGEPLKIKKTTYYSGTIFKYDMADLHVLIPQLNNEIDAWEEIKFINKDYTVINKISSIENKDCETVYHFSRAIYYRDYLIDSTDFTDDHNWGEFAWLINDTLVTYKDTEMRKFSEGKLVFHENMVDRLNQLPEIKLIRDNYYNLRVSYSVFKNYILTQMQIDVRDTTCFQPGTKITVNGIEVADSYKYFHVLLMFDKETMKFLGYPKINYAGN